MTKCFRTIFISFSFIGIAWVNLSCFCRGPELTKDLIRNSDIIFSGTLIKMDTISQDKTGDDLLLTFKPTRIFKGKGQDTIFLKSSLSSCGFAMEYKPDNREIGMVFLIYSTKKNGYFRYESCENRRVFKTPEIRREEEYGQVEYKKNVIRYDSIYTAEIIKLDSLLKIK
jgi:hypothetical protein